MAIDIVVTNNDALQAMVSYIKGALIDGSFCDSPLPHHAKAWIRKNYEEYIIINDEVTHNRLEFLLYKQIAHHILTNKLTLEHSIKYKRIEDDLMSKPKWKKNKKIILNKLGYSKLKQPIKKTLDTSELN